MAGQCSLWRLIETLLFASFMFLMVCCLLDSHTLQSLPEFCQSPCVSLSFSSYKNMPFEEPSHLIKTPVMPFEDPHYSVIWVHLNLLYLQLIYFKNDYIQRYREFECNKNLFRIKHFNHKEVSFYLSFFSVIGKSFKLQIKHIFILYNVQVLKITPIAVIMKEKNKVISSDKLLIG